MSWSFPLLNRRWELKDYSRRLSAGIVYGENRMPCRLLGDYLVDTHEFHARAASCWTDSGRHGSRLPWAGTSSRASIASMSGPTTVTTRRSWPAHALVYEVKHGATGERSGILQIVVLILRRRDCTDSSDSSRIREDVQDSLRFSEMLPLGCVMSAESCVSCDGADTQKHPNPESR